VILMQNVLVGTTSTHIRNLLLLSLHLFALLLFQLKLHHHNTTLSLPHLHRQLTRTLHLEVARLRRIISLHLPAHHPIAATVYLILAAVHRINNQHPTSRATTNSVLLVMEL
jgi:hypothetical protein